MQQIVFRTENPQMEITINDGGTSKIKHAGGTTSCPTLDLFDFDGNSLGTKSDNVSCVDMPGQHTINTRIQPRTLAVTLAFDGRSGGRDTDNSMYTLRRLIMRCFPLGVKGELEYTNSNGTFYINCYATEYPNMERTAGTRVVSTFYLIADYPFWRQSVQDGPYTVTAGQGIVVLETVDGDMESPIIGEIKCTRTMTGNKENPPEWYIYIDDQSPGAVNRTSMRFCKPLTVGQTLIFNTGIENEVHIKLIDTDGTERIANDYVDYGNSTLLKNRVGLTVWGLSVLSGEITVTMNFQNLYWSV